MRNEVCINCDQLQQLQMPPPPNYPPDASFSTIMSQISRIPTTPLVHELRHYIPAESGKTINTNTSTSSSASKNIIGYDALSATLQPITNIEADYNNTDSDHLNFRIFEDKEPQQLNYYQNNK